MVVCIKESVVDIVIDFLQTCHIMFSIIMDRIANILDWI